MLLGSMLTIMAAFISDAASPVTGSKPMVDWVVAAERLQQLALVAHDKLGRMLGS
jgi:hypothetical protein